MSKKEMKQALINGTAIAPVGAEGILTRNFRQLLKDLQIDEEKWDKLMDKYVDSVLKDVPEGEHRRVQATALRGNLTVEFARPTMTWKVYVKALRFLGFHTIDFGVRGEGNDFKHEGTVTSVVFEALEEEKKELLNDMKEVEKGCSDALGDKIENGKRG